MRFRADSVKFRAQVRNADTVDVYGQNGAIFVTFSCDPAIIRGDENCWLAFMRQAGSESKSALDFLRESWPQIEAWKRFDAVPELEVASDVIERELARVPFVFGPDAPEQVVHFMLQSGFPCRITRLHFTNASQWCVTSFRIGQHEQFVSDRGISADELGSLGRDLVLESVVPGYVVTLIVKRIRRGVAHLLSNIESEVLEGELTVFGQEFPQ